MTFVMLGTVMRDTAFMTLANKLTDSKATWTIYQETLFDGARKKGEGDFVSAIPHIFAFLKNNL